MPAGRRRSNGMYNNNDFFEFSTQQLTVTATGVLVAFVAGVLLAVVIARFREYYLNRAREEKYGQLIALGKKENEIMAHELRTEVEKEFRDREESIRQKEQSVRSALADAERRIEEIKKGEVRLRADEAEAGEDRKRLEVERAHCRHELLRMSSLSHAEVRKAVLDTVRAECETEVGRLRREILGRREEELRMEAERILVDTMQRLAPAISHEANSAMVAIPSEDMKGRLIGREGRNIKAFEQVTGTTLLIDETPESVLVSSFDPVRREIARIALANLIRDGRIHPTSIEEFVERAREEVIRDAVEIAQNAVEGLNLPSMPPALNELLGRLHFRLSVNQNTLEHSVEVAQLAGMIACELGVDPVPAKRAGLLHDIGKAIDSEEEGSHAVVGARILKQHDEDPRVVNAVAAHHREVEPESVYAAIVMIADSISATRPGARSSSMEGYVERIRSLETIAKSFPGVAEAFAVSAGRELRVIVSPDRLDEDAARETARKIRMRVEEEMQYPGTIRIMIIREQRFREEAR